MTAWINKVIKNSIKIKALSTSLFDLLPKIIGTIVVSIAVLYIWSILLSLFNGTNLKPYEISPFYAINLINSGNDILNERLWYSSAIIAFIFSTIIILSRRMKYLSSLHGDSHFSSEKEIIESGLRSKNGLILGKTGWFNPKYLIVKGPHNAVIVAPPRAGKGVGYVIPNNLNWNGSIITLDIRGQAYRETSGYRAQYSDVYKLDFLDPDGNTHGFNPFGLIDKDNKISRIDDTDKVTKKIWPPANDKGEIWQPAARSLFNALALMLIDLKSTRFTIGEINRITLDSDNFSGYLTKIMKHHKHELDTNTVRGFNGFLQKSEKEKSGVLSTINAGLELWNNPLIDAATSRSDFDIRELKEKRISIYITTKFSNIERLGTLITLFFEQVIEANTDHEVRENEPHKLLLMLDEFSLLPKMRIIEKGVAFLSGYNVITMPIIQSLSQLESVYGRAEADTFLETFKYRIFFAQNNEKTALRISQALGPITKKSFSSSVSKSGGSNSQSYIKSDLLSPNEIMRLSDKKGILLVEAASPILFNKIIWYKTKIFKERELKPAVLPKINLSTYLKSLKKPSMLLNLSDDNDSSMSDEEFSEMLDQTIGNM